ncbi:hypothetical protein IE53DRAFT_386710 [Violaceomyces palustris]|uniref:Uncharacterized protein n=1 Tax=Violaceomyces palustris TaxID=1673888 RepID=A0ACD0NYM6_9BASI|nr:hypothetical protein IE53DRAFT_386710 [Violaceomyces palustris]
MRSSHGRLLSQCLVVICSYTERYESRGGMVPVRADKRFFLPSRSGDESERRDFRIEKGKEEKPTRSKQTNQEKEGKRKKWR